MPPPNAIAPPPSTACFQLSTVNSRLFCSKPFRFTYFRKNASATPLESHSFKTKDLKPFRITYLQKKGGGYPCFPLSAASAPTALDCQLSTVDCQLTGVPLPHHRPLRPLPPHNESPITNHESPPFPNGCIISKRADRCRN